MGLFTVMCKAVLTSESVDESLTCDHRAVLSCGVVYNDAVTLCCTRWFQLLSQWMKSCVRTFKWKLLSSIFKWCQRTQLDGGGSERVKILEKHAPNSVQHFSSLTLCNKPIPVDKINFKCVLKTMSGNCNLSTDILVLNHKYASNDWITRKLNQTNPQWHALKISALR